jgi:flagellar basal-body rod protein FlgB
VLFDTTQIALERTIEGAATRQAALSGNLANANTPGYQRVDVDFHGTLQAALESGQSPTERRDALHAAGFQTAADGTGAVRADGSTVDVDAESAKLAANALEHQAAVTIARARIDILGAAMGVR